MKDGCGDPINLRDSLRIGLMCHSSVGGSALAAVELASALAGRDHDVHLFARATPPRLEASRDGVVLHMLAGTRGLEPRLQVTWTPTVRSDFIDLVVRKARRHSLDVLHFHYAVPFAQLANAVRRRMGHEAPALVGTLHGTDVTTHGHGLAAALREVDELTTVSRSHAQRSAAELGLTRTPLVIANSVDLERFRAPVATTASADCGGRRAPRILHVSNFRSIKDPVRIARAFAELRRQRSAELWLVGDGEEMARTRDLLDAHGVSDDVRYHGLRLDVETVYPGADLLLLASREESFSLVALEAAACGIPVIAPRVGGLPEVVVDGHTGLLYELDDPAEPLRTLLRALDDLPGLRAQGTAGRMHAQAFSRERMAARYEHVYRQVVDARLRGRVDVQAVAL